MHSSFLPIGLLAVIGTMISCKSSTASDIKHDIGHTSNQRQDPLEPCTAEHPDDSGYLKKLFDRITSRNPQTFKGVYAPEHFCLNLVVDEVVNAFAQPENGSITFHAGMVLMAKNDAQVAEVLAHEISHITMQSGYVPIEQKYTELQKDKAVMAASAKMKTANDVYMKAWTEDAEHYDSLTKIQEQLVASLAIEDQAAYMAKKNSYDALTKEQESFEEKYGEKYENISKDSKLSDKKKDEEYKKLEAEYQEKKNELNARLGQKWDGMMDFLVKVSVGSALGKSWQQASEKYQSLYEETEKASAVYNDAMSSLGVEVDRIVGAGTNANWTEQEADEVGLELFIRAGFDPAQFVGGHMAMIESFEGSDASKECRAMLDKINQGKVVTPPIRGNETHPTSCWRVYDLAKTELRDKHAQDYAKIMGELKAKGETPIVNLPDSKLADLQAKLRQKLGKK